ncbi:MAG: GTPase Era [Ignavibacteriales bacterium]|nr:GTPase Era [Ignavibacteriales bacterium]MCB9210216.1 GTPase Era [Ignavibacteriales bacterium]
MQTKAGFVTIIGKPNVGKSTLTNKLLGEELSIITSKPQTTRKRILGVLDEKEYQIIFLDTPGILEPKYLLQEKLLEFVESSVKDADVLIFMITAKDIAKELESIQKENIKKLISKKSQRKILVINKIDLSNEETITKALKLFENSNLFEKVIPISALENYNLDTLLNSIMEYLPIHPKFYPDDQLTDEPEKFFVAEKIREKILEIYHDEIPYSVEVYIEQFKEREKGKDYISAVIVVERESQKPIILGKKGSSIKKLGNAARQSIEDFLMREVYLELRVKVVENWRKDKRALKNFGYTD